MEFYEEILIHDIEGIAGTGCSLSYCSAEWSIIRAVMQKKR